MNAAGQWPSPVCFGDDFNRLRSGRAVEGGGGGVRMGKRAGRLAGRQVGGQTGGQTGGEKLRLTMAQAHLFKVQASPPPLLSYSLFFFLPPDAARHVGSFVPHG